MRKFSFILIGLLGCSGSMNPLQGWLLYSKDNQAVCFQHSGGPSRWTSCSTMTGEDKINCEVDTLSILGGEFISHKTKVSVFQHSSNGESKVLIEDGDHIDETLYCSTTQLRKF
jgi:hypothetical protein